MSGTVAVVAEGGLDLSAAGALARDVAGGLGVVVFVPDESEASASAAATADAGRTVVVGDALSHPYAEAAAAALEGACREEGADVVVLPATVRWREVAARLGVRLGGGCTTDVMRLQRVENGTVHADRLLYGGLVVATVELLPPAVVTTAVSSAPGLGPTASAPGTPHDARPRDPRKRLLDRRPLAPEGPGGEQQDLSMASRIVAVGRGLRRREDLGLIEDLAAALGAEIACTRPVADDLGWLPEERKVGLSGRTVRPSLYVAVGVSGAIQHLVGMRESGVVVAINVDPRAPILRAADFAIVADLYEVVPRLTAALATAVEG